MKYNKFLLAAAISLFFNNLSAQNGMYQWRTHLAYNNISQVAMTKDKVYAVSDGSLFSVTKSDKHIETYSKITGLNDNNVIFIAYSQKHGKMLVAYQNGNIDFVADNGQVANFPDIYRANLNTAKELNDVIFDGDYAYLSYPFGIAKLSLQKMEIADTYFIGTNGSFVNVKSVSILGGYFYAVAADKIYKAPTSGSNLVNFENWQVLSDTPEPLTPNVKAIAYNSKLYLLKNNGKVHTLSNDLWQNDAYLGITNICTNDNVLFVIANNVVNCSKSQQPINIGAAVKMAIYDNSQSKIWFAASSLGIVLSDLTASETPQNFIPNGPATNIFKKLKYANGRIYAVSGGRKNNINPDNIEGNVMIFENNDWKNIISAKIASVGGNARDFFDIAVDKNDKNDKTHFYVASYQNGIYEFRDDEPFRLYNNANGVESSGSGANQHRIEALYFDKSSRLWFCSGLLSATSATIKYLEPDPDGAGPLLSQVKNLFYTETSEYVLHQQILPSPENENLKFMINVGIGRGFFVFDDKGTPDNVLDDNKRNVTVFTDQEGKTVNPGYIWEMAQDKKNNSMWAATSTGGVMVLSNLQNIFNSDYRVTRIKIARNDGSGLADYLLDNAHLKAIAIDGENRKWIGTETEGVFLISDDGKNTIHHFTAENSPLLSNNIISIAINDKTGEVFFATEKGLISFQYDGTVSPPKPFEELHAYPNPVRPGYLAEGKLITITGLGFEDSDATIVKIVDTAGNLVYEDIRKGGTVTWDGRRRGGAIVSTGVYIAICTTKDGKYHATTKILIVN